jgi:serine protease inhibitor
MYSQIALFLVSCLAVCTCDVEFSERPRNFSIELLYHTQSETDGHVVISPFGVWTLMAGLMLGATGESLTELSRATFLLRDTDHLKGYKNLMSTVLSPKTPDVSLSSSNFLFLDKSFSVYPQFRKTVEEDLKASIHILDFQDPAAVEAANAAIEKSGANVKNVLRSNDFTQSVMLMTNVIAFKGVWSTPFNATATKEEVFYDHKGKSIGHVNMMYQTAVLPFSNIRAMESNALELPYGTDGKYSMLFLLPHPGVNVIDVYSKLAKHSLKDIFKQLKEDVETYDDQEIDVKIPRFLISTNVVLNKPLNDMGVYDIFDPDRATFGNVAEDDIFVSAIVHKADIEVTETGTVATGSTTAHIVDKITPSKFHANRPFIYFLMEKSTTTIIFGGIYSKPTVY